jgi:hypothetical protein
MSYEKIHCVNHVGRNLLIVGYNAEKKWEFRAVTKEGNIVNQVSKFSTAQRAEEEGYNWIKDNLPLE